MKYMGSKRRIAKEILPIILSGRRENQWYVEPFIGGGNLIDKVEGNRIGSDINKYLIAFLKYVQENDFNPKHVGEVKYREIQKNKDKYPDWLVGYVGFNLSFGAKFFGGYGRDNVGKRDYENEAQQNIKAQQPALRGIQLSCCSYDELDIPTNSIIYCDPPYWGTTKYKNSIDYGKFWEWVRQKFNEGHRVFVSEYNAPKDFVCVWQKEIVSSLTKNTGEKVGVEKLFVYENQNTIRQENGLTQTTLF